ncbi:MAG: hypothetical protein AAGA30_19860 [Planctomycetota bacterium]
MLRFGIRSLLVLTTVVAASVAYYQYTKYYKRWNEIEGVVTNFDGDRYEYSNFYRQIFQIAESDLLPWLMRHENDSIALQSAWESVERSVPIEMGPATFTPGNEELVAFLQFAADRFNAPIPEWWRQLVVKSRANRRYNIYFFNDDIESPYHGTELEWVECPNNAILENKADGVVYRVDDDSILVSNETLDRDDSESLFGNLSGCFTTDLFFVTVHSDAGFPHTVSCIDRKSNDVIWQSEAFGCFIGGTSGIHYSWVELVPTNDNRIFLFGFACTGLYMECFDSRTGESLFHFSSGY